MSMAEEDFAEVDESKTDYNILRKNLSHYLMKIFSENSDSEYPQKIYEIGRVFEMKDGKIAEKENLAAAISPGNFTEIRQIIEYLGRMLDLNFTISEKEQSLFLIEGRVGKIMLDGKEIGFIGEVHPKILRNWRIKMPVAIFEIDLEEVFGKLS
jgi:phenylalanyl-tRNA synthetase beta chain